MAIWLILYQPPHLNRWLSADEYFKLKSLLPPPEEARPASTERVHWRTLLAARGCWTLILTRFFTDPVIYFVIFWLPEYLRKERGFNLAQVGKYSWVPFAFGGVGYVLGRAFGEQADYLFCIGWIAILECLARSNPLAIDIVFESLCAH